jgi:hypothetical protein
MTEELQKRKTFEVDLKETRMEMEKCRSEITMKNTQLDEAHLDVQRLNTEVDILFLHLFNITVSVGHHSIVVN